VPSCVRGEGPPPPDNMINIFCSVWGEPINVGFAGTKIAALNRVVEQAINAVAIVLIIFFRINAALRCNGMRAPRRILKTKAFPPVSEFTKSRRGRSAGEPAADDYDLK